MTTTNDNEITAREIITIGSDPEFAIVSPTDRNRVFDACAVFRPKGDAVSRDCDFGYDGHSATGEIRPEPQKHPKDAVKAIKALLERNKKIYPQAFKFNLMATSQRLSLGGHIHFGHPKLTREGNPYWESLTMQMVRNLDNLLAFPCMYLENPKDGQHRKIDFGYGHLSDWREQNWGFEYRTLSSFIASEELTRDVFYLGHAIADATINHNFKCKEITTQSGFDYAFNDEARDFLRPHLSAIFKQEMKLPKVKAEKDYKEAVEDFIELVKKEVPLFDVEIKKGWHIKFDISDFWKVDRIETLVEKIAKTLIAIHTKKDIMNPIKIKFVSGSYKDLSCPEIAKNVNLALNNLIPQEVLDSQTWKTIKVYGLNGKKGNKIHAGYMGMTTKRKKQMLGIFWDIADNFQHTTKITEILSYHPEARSNSIYFGRKIREENLLLPEAMTIIAVLLLNKDLYKQSQKKGRKETKLYLTQNKVILPLIKHIKKNDKFIVKPPKVTSKKILNIDLPFIFDLDKNYSQIEQRFRELEETERRETADTMFEIAKKFRTLYKKRKTCTRKCNHKLTYDSPIIKYCGKCMADKIRDLCMSNLGFVSSAKWNNLFMGTNETRHCNNCENNKPADQFCNDCDYCFECCDCNACEICGNHNDDCTCWICNGCDEKFEDDDSDFCHDCERCGTCGCTCDHDEEDEHEPISPHDQASEGTPTPTTTTDNANPSQPITYRTAVENFTGGIDLTRPFTPEAQMVQMERTSQAVRNAQPRATPLDRPPNQPNELIDEHARLHAEAIRSINRDTRERVVGDIHREANLTTSQRREVNRQAREEGVF